MTQTLQQSKPEKEFIESLSKQIAEVIYNNMLAYKYLQHVKEIESGKAKPVSLEKIYDIIESKMRANPA